MHHHPLPRRLLSLLALLAIASPSAAPAANFTWVGGSPFGTGNSNWSTLANWSTGIAPPNDGTADLIFSGNLRVNPTANTAWNINTLTFSSTDQSFTVGGSTLTLSSAGVPPVAPLIINSSSHAHVVNNTLVFANNGTINASTGDLTFGGSYISNDGNTVTLTAASGRTLTFNTVLTGLGNYTKTGAGTALVNNTSIYTGITTISAGTLELAGSINNSETVNLTGGTLRLAANERLSNSAVLTMSSGTVFDLAGYTETIQRLTGAGSVTLGTGGSLILNQDSGSYTFSGVISGAGGFTKGGLGSLTLSGANSYTGDTVITGGTLALGASNIIGNSSDVVVNSGTTLQLNSYTDTVYSLSGDGLVNLGTGALTVSGALANHTFSGTLTGNGTFTKSGGGTQTLAGSMTGTGSTLNVSGGILNLTGTSAAATVNVSSSGRLRLVDNHNRLSTDANVNLSTTLSTLELYHANQTINTLTGTGVVSLTSSDLTVSPESEFTFNGRIGGTGAFTLTGSGIMNWGGTGVSNYIGSTTLGGNVTLKLAASDRLSAVSVLHGSLANGSILDLNGYNQTLAAVIFDGEVRVPTGSTLTIAPNGHSQVHNSAKFTGGGDVRKTGSDSIYLDLQPHTGSFTGDLIIDEGAVVDLRVQDGARMLGTLRINGSASVEAAWVGARGGADSNFNVYVIKTGSSSDPQPVLTVTGSLDFHSGRELLV